MLANIITLFFFSICAPAIADELYKCDDKLGHTTYSATICPAGSKCSKWDGSAWHANDCIYADAKQSENPSPSISTTSSHTMEQRINYNLMITVGTAIGCKSRKVFDRMSDLVVQGDNEAAKKYRRAKGPAACGRSRLSAGLGNKR